MPKCIGITRKNMECTYNAKYGEFCGFHVPKNAQKKECGICFEDNLSPKMRSLKCGHEFCISCIDKWFKRCDQSFKDETCPTCRNIEKKCMPIVQNILFDDIERIMRFLTILDEENIIGPFRGEIFIEI